jgi:hypothetical protein
MPTSLRTLIAATVLVVPLETTLADEPNQQAQSQKTHMSEVAPTRILERTQEPGAAAVKPLALPAALAHWIDENSRSRVEIGVTIAR